MVREHSGLSIITSGELTLFLWCMPLLSRVYHVTFYIDEEMGYIVMFSAQVPSAVYLIFCDPLANLFLFYLT